MTMALVDNDVVVKLAAFRLGSQLHEAIDRIGARPATMLGVGRYVVYDRLTRASWLSDRQPVLAAVEELLSNFAFVEPSDEELAIAAEFESVALRRNLELHGGESQLFTILINRHYRVLLTGDKRAIRAIAGIAGGTAHGKLACFEQVLLDIAARSDIGAMRDKVCGEPKADRAAAICFSCFAAAIPDLVDIVTGLNSYVEDLRAKAGGVLVRSADLSALAP